MKKKYAMPVFIITVVVTVVIAFYICMAVYYKNHFTFGTRINNVYCAGLSVDEVNSLLIADKQDTILEVVCFENVEKINLTELGVSYDYLEALKKEMKVQNNWFWGIQFILPQNIVVKPNITFEIPKVEEKLSKYSFSKNDIYSVDNTISIVKSEQAGYILEDHTLDQLDLKIAYPIIEEAIREEMPSIDLLANRCYKTLPQTNQVERVRELYKKIQQFQDFSMVYHFGESDEVVDSAVISDWIALDENGEILLDEEGNLILDEERIFEYVKYLAMRYDTLGKTREFKATNGRVVSIDGGTYGNELDIEAEYEFLKSSFLQHQSGERNPQYLTQALYQGKDDIGDTYIEVDMTDQKMYYYRKGKILLQTDVVTGNHARGMDTPQRVCYVYFKQKNRILRGADYATPVKFWMAVNGHIGIHDATWRKEFGKDIYLTSGSHGCVNTPLGAMEKLYDMVEEGTPVIIFY